MRKRSRCLAVVLLVLLLGFGVVGATQKASRQFLAVSQGDYTPANTVRGRSLLNLCASYIDTGAPVLIWLDTQPQMLVGYNQNAYYLTRQGDTKPRAYPKTLVRQKYAAAGKQAQLLKLRASPAFDAWRLAPLKP